MSQTLSSDLIRRLRGPLRILRSAPRLLVFDFDGTLSPLAARPADARLQAGTARALRNLGAQKGTVLAVLSGRSLGSLRGLVPPGLVLSGSHGLRASRKCLGVEVRRLAPYRSALRARLPRLRELAAAVPGALVENKGFGVALHYRLVPRARVAALLKSARTLFKGSGFRGLDGKEVLEFRPPLGGGKAGGLGRLARKLAPGWRRGGACLFVGDDRTDEDAFKAARRMGRRMLCIKVGPGRTAADWRFASRSDVDGLLSALVSAPATGFKRV